MQGILYEEHSALLFILVTVVMGGAAAFQMGRATAQTWRPLAMVTVYALLLTAGVRFLHFALFEGTLLSIQYFIVDFVVVLAFTALGFRRRRVEQMRTQYSFAFAGAGPFNWRRKVQ
jgi:uncharacterized membrane protein SirB2